MSSGPVEHHREQLLAKLLLLLPSPKYVPDGNQIGTNRISTKVHPPNKINMKGYTWVLLLKSQSFYLIQDLQTFQNFVAMKFFDWPAFSVAQVKTKKQFTSQSFSTFYFTVTLTVTL